MSSDHFDLAIVGSGSAAFSAAIRASEIVAEGAGDVILAADYAVQLGLTVDQAVDTWTSYLTMSEALKLTAQTFDLQVAHLSCCA